MLGVDKISPPALQKITEVLSVCICDDEEAVSNSLIHSSKYIINNHYGLSNIRFVIIVRGVFPVWLRR